jgi:hypothetical protein
VEGNPGTAPAETEDDASGDATGSGDPSNGAAAAPKVSVTDGDTNSLEKKDDGDKPGKTEGGTKPAGKDTPTGPDGDTDPPKIGAPTK